LQWFISTKYIVKTRKHDKINNMSKCNAGLMNQVRMYTTDVRCECT